MEDAARAKVDGLRHVLDAIDLSALRLLVSFGSVIARVGLPGEAHYAWTNARLRLLTERVAASLRHCRALTIEWSVWAAVGMGERLGRVDALQHRGITAIDVDRGVDLLARLLDPSIGALSVIAAGRLGEASPIPIAGGEVPFHRFLEMPRVHYPGVELVADADVSTRTDPYLEDHQLDDELLFPAVMGLEAMTRAAMAVAATSAIPAIEQVEFERPIVARRDGTITLRTLALALADDEVHVALRSSATAFQVDHFRAVCRWHTSGQAAGPPDNAATPPELQSARELYGPLFFQTGRFAWVRGYRHLRATACQAETTRGSHPICQARSHSAIPAHATGRSIAFRHASHKAASCRSVSRVSTSCTWLTGPAGSERSSAPNRATSSRGIWRSAIDPMR
jgi:enediyne polyketide synthase